MLRVINPAVTYKVEVSEKKFVTVHGVAIRLKDFLLELDQHSIPHQTEKTIRKWIRKEYRCKSYMKQFFLKDGSNLTRICRSIPDAVCCKTCIGIAKEVVPEEFFEIFAGIYNFITYQYHY